MTDDSLHREDLPFSAMSRSFARFIGQLARVSAPELELAAALVSHAAEQGHVCFDLARPRAVLARLESEISLDCPDPESWREVLAATEVVGQPGDFKPLILDDRDRLYLYRFWRDQQYLADELGRRARAKAENLDADLLRTGLDRLFGGPPVPCGEPDWQRVATVATMLHGFSVISGGPGTGKTSTVVKILALLLEQAGSAPLHIALAAPTGKAAARLVEAIRSALEVLPLDAQLRARIPQEARTLHRLLGFSGRTGAFRHNAGYPLPQDVVIVDEASMVDLPLMARLLEALRPQCRLILLGDRDQLASVEAGAVLGDLAGPRRENRFSANAAARMAEIAGIQVPSVDDDYCGRLSDAVVLLQKSYRFREDSAIGRLSRAINAGDGAGAWTILADRGQTEAEWRPAPPKAQLETELEPVFIPAFRSLLQSSSPEEALSRLDTFRVLCALRRGPYGVETVNRTVHSLLQRQGLVRGASPFYRGRPIMVTGNDYAAGLFNGDVGLVWPDPEGDGSLRAFFSRAGGGVRKFSLSRLPAHETVFAMTVHKSQGSEFDEILLIMPDRPSEVLSRELVYTALTRARTRATIWGDEEVFLAAVERRIMRNSGLEDLLWE